MIVWMEAGTSSMSSGTREAVTWSDSANAGAGEGFAWGGSALASTARRNRIAARDRGCHMEGLRMETNLVGPGNYYQA